MTHPQNDALKPCPFCQSGPARQEGRYTNASFSGVELMQDTIAHQWYVCCGTCGSSGPPEGNEAKAVAAWNHRDDRTEALSDLIAGDADLVCDDAGEVKRTEPQEVADLLEIMSLTEALTAAQAENKRLREVAAKWERLYHEEAAYFEDVLTKLTEARAVIRELLGPLERAAAAMISAGKVPDNMAEAVFDRAHAALKGDDHVG